MNYLAQHFWNDVTCSIDGKKLWDALQPHIEKGDLVVNVGKEDREGLVLVTYSKTYQYEHNSVDWDPLVKHCRGIIFDTTDNYNIVALPLSKFFNYGEGGIHYPSEGATIHQVFDKEDGSLGICFYWRGLWKVTTRGSLNSDIGAVGQKIFDETIKENPTGIVLNPYFTYLFEIIDPICRIVVKYDESKLVLLGLRNRNTGVCYFGGNAMPTWPHYANNRTFENQQQMLQWLNQTKGTEFEGFVVHFSDGSIFKFKSVDYMRLHRIIAQFTFKRVLEAVQQHAEEEIRKALPEELIPEFDAYVSTIYARVKDIYKRVNEVVKEAPKNSRKDFAIWLQTYHKGTIAMKYAFKYIDTRYDVFLEHILQSLDHNEFKIEEKEKDE